MCDTRQGGVELNGSVCNDHSAGREGYSSTAVCDTRQGGVELNGSVCSDHSAGREGYSSTAVCAMITQQAGRGRAQWQCVQ